MFTYLVLAWLVLSIPFAVLVGKCITFGQARVTWPGAEDGTALRAEAGSLPSADDGADHADSELDNDVPALPAQRQPLVPSSQVN